MKKKIFAAAILVLVLASGALAYQSNNGSCGNAPQSGGMHMGQGGPMRQDLTPEQKVKMDEIRKLREDIRVELQKEIPNKSKAREMHSKLQKLDNEMESARFEEVLKNPEKFLHEQKGPKGQRKEFSAADKTKFNEMRTLNKELRTESQKETPNKAKMRELHGKIQTIRISLDDARFEEMLKNPKDFGKGKGPGQGFKPGCSEQ